MTWQQVEDLIKALNNIADAINNLAAEKDPKELWRHDADNLGLYPPTPPPAPPDPFRSE